MASPQYEFSHVCLSKYSLKTLFHPFDIVMASSQYEWAHACISSYSLTSLFHTPNICKKKKKKIWALKRLLCEKRIFLCLSIYSSNLVIPALLNNGKSYIYVKWSMSNGFVLPSGGAALTRGRCVNNRATLHSLIWDLAKLGDVLQIALQILNLRKNVHSNLLSYFDRLKRLDFKGEYIVLVHISQFVCFLFVRDIRDLSMTLETCQAYHTVVWYMSNRYTVCEL